MKRGLFEIGSEHLGSARGTAVARFFFKKRRFECFLGCRFGSS